MRRDVLVYISGPMTATAHKSIEQHTAAGVDTFLRLMKHGVPAFCPHLGGAFPSVWTALTHDEWCAYDEAMIDRCTHLLMIGDWRHSKGACREYDYATAKGLPICYSVDDLLWSLGIGHG